MKTRYTKSGESGVTAIEMALVIPILLMLVFGAIDLARYYMAISILNESASRALSVARTTANFDVDFRGLAETSREYYRFKTARSRAVIAASNVALASIIDRPEYKSSMLRLTKLKQTDKGLSVPVGGAEPEVNEVAAILRPGDCLEYEDGTNYCNTATLGTTTVPDRSPEFLMNSHPIEVVMRAEVKPFLPFFKAIYPNGLNASVRTYAYREYIPNAGFVDEPAETIGAAPVDDPNKPTLGAAQCREDEPVSGTPCLSPSGTSYGDNKPLATQPFMYAPMMSSSADSARRPFYYGVCSPPTLGGTHGAKLSYEIINNPSGYCSL